MRRQPSLLTDYLIKAVFALIISIPLVGFITGMVICDCGSNMVNRLIVGGVMAIMAIIEIGMPPVSQHSAEVYNLWPYIFLCAVALTVTYTLVRKIWEHKTALH